MIGSRVDGLDGGDDEDGMTTLSVIVLLLALSFTVALLLVKCRFLSSFLASVESQDVPSCCVDVESLQATSPGLLLLLLF